MLKKVLPLICLMVVPFVWGCKKDAKELLKHEETRAGRSQLNTRLSEMKEGLNKARTDYERAEIYTDIAEVEIKKGDYASSIKSSTSAIKYQPNQYRSHFLLGKSFISAGRFDEAVQELQISIELKNDFVPAHFELGNAFYKKKYYTSALNEYSKTVQLDPDYYMAHNNMGVIYSLTGKAGESIESFKNAVKIKSDFSSAYKNLGIMYDVYMKDKESAIENYKKYLELCPNSRDRRLVKSWIETLGG